MNNGNCLGAYVALSSPAPTEKSHKSYNPPIQPTPKQQGIYDSIKKWLNEQLSEINEAVHQPWEGLKGGIKGTLNSFPDMLEMSIQNNIKNIALEETDNPVMLLAGLFRDGKISLSETASREYQLANEIKLPEFTLNNPAQEGGATLAMLFPFIPGTLKKVVTTEAKVTEAAGETTRGGVKVAQESLEYAPTAKHAKGGWGTLMDLDDKTAQDILNRSIKGGKQRYAYYDGKLYEFQPDARGGWHGYPIKGTEANPPSVLKEMLKRGDFSKSEYSKLIKGK